MAALRLNPPSLPTPLAAYSQVVRKGPIITTAGVVALDSDGNVVGEGDIEAQTRKVLDGVRAAIEAAGGTMEDVVKTTVFIADLADYKGMNSVYNEVFGDAPPARSTIRADLVLPTLLVEIEAVAVVD